MHARGLTLVFVQDWNTMLRMEEEYIENMCAEIIAFKPDIVITEKGVSDLAQHFFTKAGITAFRRLRKTDNNRVARACGATIVSRTDEIQESDLGTGCGLFEVRKLGDEVSHIHMSATHRRRPYLHYLLDSTSPSWRTARMPRRAPSSSEAAARMCSTRSSAT